MIEIKKSSANDSAVLLELLLDGQQVSKSIIGESSAEHIEGNKSFVGQSVSGKLYAWIEEDISERFLAHRFSDLPEEVATWRLDLVTDFSDLFKIEEIRRSADQNVYEVIFESVFTFDDWKQLYSFKEYYLEFKHNVQGVGLTRINVEPEEQVGDQEYVTNGFYIGLELSAPTLTIEQELMRCENIIYELSKGVEKSLNQKAYGTAVVTYFNFPPEVKVTCEQYLLFFADFLRDVGVEATAEIEEQAGEVLFIVTPNDKRVALEKIRLALEIFLQFPREELATTSSFNENAIAIQRLSANIHHLKSQLLLAQAMLQAKDATLQAQQTTIEYQQRLISGEIVLDSMQNREKKPTDKEELFAGTLAITKYQGKGFEVNLPELLRRLRQFFGQE